VKHGVKPTATTATTAAVSWTSKGTASATATAAAIKQQSNGNSNDKQLPHLRKQIRHNGSSFPLFPLARLDLPGGEVLQKGWPRASGGRRLRLRAPRGPRNPSRLHQRFGISCSSNIFFFFNPSQPSRVQSSPCCLADWLSTMTLAV
jgi:hypothetical protein